MIRRRVSKTIHVGDVPVGGQSPITVQSMTKTDTRDVKATVNQIRELEDIGCDIITATSDLLRKLQLAGKDLTEYSLNTVQMFYNDARTAGYQL